MKQPLSPFRTLFFCTLIFTISGCATYQAKPLNLSPKQPLNINELVSLAPAGAVSIDDGLNLTEIATLAIYANPILEIKRAQLKVSQAQVFSAGLLPDPQLSMSLDKPNSSTAVNAWSAGLNFDTTWLFTRTSALDAEKYFMTQNKLNLLWAEWQVVQRVQTLTIQYKLELQQLALLNKIHDLYQVRLNQSQHELAAGNLTLETYGPVLTALLDINVQLSQLAQKHSQTHHDFCLEMGIDSSTTLNISDLPSLKVVPKNVADSLLTNLAGNRPDLLALSAGYQAQESRYHQAILKQFPALTAGITHAKDTGGLVTNGIGVGLSLPLFNANKGNIAIEEATREQLRMEFNERMTQSRNQVEQLLALQSLLAEEQQYLDQHIPPLQYMVTQAQKALKNGEISSLTMLTIETSLLNKQLEQLRLKQSIWNTSISLNALLAIPAEVTYSTPQKSMESI
ncbi:hypothetical protein CXF86_14925 [Shewanella sp. GutCb]|uniref:TolC family protein n=1 Tax=Shewanella sp. GutCb TaxID=2058315 RepID=UPI000C7A6AB9|nr:TolC family protein [Shewanella sp. GutCb]PKG73982.1 hypothetical protein CXF86_14925 [Shewanella sp. GutCb]